MRFPPSRHFSRFVVLLIGFFTGLSSFAPQTAPAADASDARPPDIVVFLSDDHTWRDSSLYGSPDFDTPNMARIAETGMTFNQAFVASPSCAPSRAAMLTGLYPANNGAEPNHARPRPGIKKLPAYLQELGYEVVSFGKVGHYRQTAAYGFDLARHFGYHEDVAIPKALEWLRERESDQPLCLFVGTNWPHVPWPEETGEIDPAELQIPPNHVTNSVTRKWRARYAAAVKIMDDELGQVYDLAREKLGDDTFFLHTSDHGAQWPFGKWTLYEDGIRTPMIASWPGRIEAGGRTEAMVSWVDILPTLVEVAGGETPNEIDGRSFLPVLRGETDQHRDVILTTHSGDGSNNVFPIRSARTRDGWKYIRNLRPDLRNTSHVTNAPRDSGYWDSWVESAIGKPAARQKVRGYLQRPAEELYQVNEDPWERDNRIDDPEVAERLASLRAAVDEWMEKTDDPKAIYGEPKRRAGPDQPNIITVFIDDMGWSDLSCFGGDVVKTENIDRLAGEGIRFHRFYVNSPICSPSRVALTTGQYPQRWRISSYLAHRQLNIDRGMAQWLDPDAPSLPRELRLGGYATGHFGKWHMGGQRDVGDAPLISEYGFDKSLTNFEGLGPRVLPLKAAFNGEPPRKHALGSDQLGKGPIRWEDRSVITAAFVDEALHFIDRAEATDQPFYINLWPDDVHSPFFPPEALREEADGGKRELYLAVLKAMDDQLGELFDRVRDDQRLRDNTLIVVCSDNGHEQGAGRSDPLRGGKTWLYEGGVRSPLIVWGPGMVDADAAGTVNDESIFSAIDLNVSLYAIAGVEPPDGKELDGEDVSETILGTSKRSRTAPIFFRRPPDRPGTDDDPNPDLAVRDGRWKYLVHLDGSREQLYDLSADISESNNVASQHPDVAKRLKEAVLTWNAEMPVDAVDPDFEPEGVAAGRLEPLPADQFVNPIGEGADPWVVHDQDNDRYLWCFSEGNRAIAVHTGDRLTSFGQKRIVWRAPDSGPTSQQVWAPELHRLDDRWYIYFAASDGQNENHLAYVLESEGDDPLGSYQLHGPLATGDGDDGRSPNVWAIDMTVLEHADKRYAIWSGWDRPGSDRQYLYIAPMKSPTELAGPRIRICDNDDHPWEMTESGDAGRGLNEAPQVVRNGDRVYLSYSCGASWLTTYKLGLLDLVGDDPAAPGAWHKRRRPRFEGDDRTFGVGHSCVVESPDGSERWHVFHAKRDREPGWRRVVHAQPMRFGRKGLPLLGDPIPAGEPLPRPSGETVPRPQLPLSQSLRAESLDGWSYFGHHQFLNATADGVELGRVPDAPVNEFRSGEKLVLDGKVSDDFHAEVDIDFFGNGRARDAGLLFRTTAASVGYDAQRGYFAGLIPRTGLAIFGLMDGHDWTEIARAPVEIDASKVHRFGVTAKGDRVTLSLNGKPLLTTTESTFGRGTIGLRVVNTHARFANLEIVSSANADMSDATNKADAANNSKAVDHPDVATNPSGAKRGEDEPPNVILVMADDHGWGDTGYVGHPFAKTPSLDRMAEEGIRFDRWYAAAPVCSPTRGSCLTGRHPDRYGITFANTGRLPSDEVCLAEALRDTGYRTGHFGKWHLGTLTTEIQDANRGGPGSEDVYSPPWDNGFDVCFSTESKVPTYDPAKNPANVSREPKRGVPEGGPFGTYFWTGPGERVPAEELRGDTSELVMDRAVEFIRDAAMQNSPFFTVIWFHAPHTPVVADEEHRSLYPDHPLGLYGQHYHGCITAMDEQIGRLRQRLDELGVADNTMLWYCSDNGPESNAKTGAGTSGPFRGRKRSLYEGGVRVPGLLVWPDRVSEPRQTSVPCVTSDYLPTILDAVGIELPDRPLDGISLMPLIDGEMQQRGEPIEFRSRKQVALSGDRYKLYSGDRGETWELYDLLEDPQEAHDLAAAEPERVETMSATLQAWQDSVDASTQPKDE